MLMTQLKCVSSLVPTYTLNVISKIYNKNDFGPYRDDGWVILKTKTGIRTNKEKHPENIQTTWIIYHYIVQYKDS